MARKQVEEITAEKTADLDALRENWFGKATFFSATYPTSGVMEDNLVGCIKQGRAKHWVIRKPNRQKGDKPKVEKKFKLDADLVKGLEARAEVDRCYLVDVVEAALTAYLKPPF